ncbi:MAG: mobile mystery protein A [Leadbetterella sp.]|nr:mobile mystery protein A [Leadbetterella sp.]
MNMTVLQRKQLSRKIAGFERLNETLPPVGGWIKAIRTALGMSLEQLGNKLGISRQSVMALEIREKSHSITLRSLSETAEAMDMKLVYALVPKDGTLEALIERKAEELARKIVTRTSQSMKLEGQENPADRLMEAFEERKADILQKLPKALWD